MLGLGRGSARAFTVLAALAAMAWPALAEAQIRNRIVLLEQETAAGRCWQEAERRTFFDEGRLVDVWEVDTLRRQCSGALGFDFSDAWRAWRPPSGSCDAAAEWCRGRHVDCRIGTQDLRSTCMVEAPSFARSVCTAPTARGPGGARVASMELQVTCGASEVRFAGDVETARGEWALRAVQSPGDDALYDCELRHHDPDHCLSRWTEAFAGGLPADVRVAEYLSLVYSVNLRPAGYADLADACDAAAKARNRKCDAMLRACAAQAGRVCTR